MKNFFLQNWGTKLMAVALAFLLWVYLFNESTDSVELTNVAFAPVVLEKDLASIKFTDSSGRVIVDTIDLKITGPKGELRAVSRKGLRCEPILDQSAFTHAVSGEFERALTAEDLNLPDNFTVKWGAFEKILVKYVKYKSRRVKILCDITDHEGAPSPGYEVRGLRVDPDEVSVKLPANREMESIRILKVPIGNRSESFTRENWQIAPEEGVYQLTNFRVDVRIELRVVSKEFNVPLVMAGPWAVTRRLELLTNAIKVQVSGSDAVVAKVTPDILFAFVVVDLTEGLLEEGKKYTLDKIHCIVRNETLAPDLRIVVMSDVVKPENRQVEVKVLPK